MTHDEAVKAKIARQKEAGITVTQENVEELYLKAKEELKKVIISFEPHDFQQSYMEQESFEPRKFLFYKYNEKVRTLKVPTGLCYVCRLLEIQHA